MLTRPINAKDKVARSFIKERKSSTYKLTECEIIDKRPSTDLYDRENNLRKFGHICQLIHQMLCGLMSVLLRDSSHHRYH